MGAACAGHEVDHDDGTKDAMPTIGDMPITSCMSDAVDQFDGLELPNDEVLLRKFAKARRTDNIQVFVFDADTPGPCENAIAAFTLPGDSTIGYVKQLLFESNRLLVCSQELSLGTSSAPAPLVNSRNISELVDSFEDHLMRGEFRADSDHVVLKLSIRTPVAYYSTVSGKFQSTNFVNPCPIPIGGVMGVGCMAVHWESNRALVGLQLWDIGHMKLIKCATTPPETVSCVAIDWSGAEILSGTDDGRIQLWIQNREDISLVKSIEVHRRKVACIVVDWKAKRALTASKDCTLRHLDVENLCSMQTFEGHTSWVQCVAVDWGASRALSGSADARLCLWDMVAGESIAEIEAHDSIVQSVWMDWSSLLALSASMDKSLKLWDLSTSECIRTFLGHPNWINCTSVHWESRRICSGDADGLLKIWDLETGECTVEHQASSEAIVDVAVYWELSKPWIV